MKEEVSLDVAVKELLLDEIGLTDPQGPRTYLCEVLSGEVKTGYDPEYDPAVEAAGLHGMVEVRWFDLRSEADWDPMLVNDKIIYRPLQQVMKKLGYLS